MDDLDRLYRRLLQNIRSAKPEYLHIAFTVQELYEHLVPYRHNRRELAIESNQDYETAVARLLSGERGYVTSDPVMQEALRRELASPTGEHGIFKEYANSSVAFTAAGDISERVGINTEIPARADPEVAGDAKNQQHSVSSDASMDRLGNNVTSSSTSGLVSGVTDTSTGSAMNHTIPPAQTSSQAGTSAASPVPVPSLLSSLTNITVPTSCSFCSGTLPDDREVNYCPHCGENLRVRRCPACGGEMESSWKFCVICGRRGA